MKSILLSLSVASTLALSLGACGGNPPRTTTTTTTESRSTDDNGTSVHRESSTDEVHPASSDSNSQK